MTQSQPELIIITPEEVGERLDRILAQRFENRYSRTYFQTLLDQHLVLLNGSPVKKRTKPIAGDEVEIQFIITPDINIEPENIPLDIIYEDESMLVINKPPGMVVHPAVGNWTGTFVNALLYHCKQLPRHDLLRPGIVHRLDKDTSGVLVAAKTTEMHQKLTELFATRKVYKEYWAITTGNPGNQNIDAPIGRHPVDRKKMAVTEKGKQAISYCKTLKCDGKISLVKIIITTGRTHQIRVHMKHIGNPILGDPIYGNPSLNTKYKISHQLLHAAKLKFTHPFTNKEMEFIANPPEDLQFYIDKLSTSNIV